MKKLLYINNYNCTNLHKEGYPDNHLWGVDALSRIYKVKCAKVPGNLFKITFKGSARINNFWKSLVMLIRYFNYDTVYSACGELTDAFALANILRIKHRRLFMIQHHGSSRILFPKGYTKIIFISPVIKKLFPQIANSCFISWGGQQSFADKFGKALDLKYDFVSAGAAVRDFQCMATAMDGLDGSAAIITNKVLQYDQNKIDIIGGPGNSNYSVSYENTYKYYSESKFICIPTKVLNGKKKYTLSGLTSFVDAVVMHKPVIISDSTNMGIDVESLGIGTVYKAGDVEDMRNKMLYLMSLSDSQYHKMCDNMERYSKGRTYDDFCNKLLKIIRES